MKYLLANNASFDIDSIRGIVRAEDEVIHFNKHIFLEQLIDLKCKHSLFFNFPWEGVEEYLKGGYEVDNIYYFTLTPLPEEIDKWWKHNNRYESVQSIINSTKSIDCGLWDNISPSDKIYTIGFKAVYYFIETGSCSEEISLVGFNHTGCNKHPWREEKKYLHDMCTILL